MAPHPEQQKEVFSKRWRAFSESLSQALTMSTEEQARWLEALGLHDPALALAVRNALACSTREDFTTFLAKPLFPSD
jgi:hypothetical protein